MDIQIVHAELHPSGQHIDIHRTLDGGPFPQVHRMPKEILSLRAAEYNLDVDDPRVLDMILLEHLIEIDDPNETHPLYAMDTVEDALAEMERRLDKVRATHGKPQGVTFLAEAKAPSRGLVVAQQLLKEHADPAVTEPVQFHRDIGRARVKALKSRKVPTLAETQRARMMGHIQGEALAEGRQREDAARRKSSRSIVDREGRSIRGSGVDAESVRGATGTTSEGTGGAGH